MGFLFGVHLYSPQDVLKNFVISQFEKLTLLCITRNTSGFTTKLILIEYSHLLAPGGQLIV